jgi:uncharacterized alkaline shock family protein YloU
MKEVENTFGVGHIKIADEVVALIAGTAALEVEGVEGMTGNITNGISVILGRKSLSKGVKVVVENDEVTIDVNITVKFGCKINGVCLLVQDKIKTTVETMTALSVLAVNVNVSSINYEKLNLTEADML